MPGCRSDWRPAWKSGGNVRVLIVKTSSLGDLVHAMPVARGLIRAGHEVDWLVNEEYAGLVELVEGIGRVLPFPRQRLKSPKVWPSFRRVMRSWKQESYDLGLDLQGLLKSAVLGRLIHPGRLIGLEDAREGSRWFYDEIVTLPRPRAHAIIRCVAALEYLNIPVPKPLDYGLTNVAAPGSLLPGGLWVGLQAGARWPTKLWPEQYWFDLVRLAEKELPQVRFAVLGGSDSEKMLGKRLGSSFPRSVSNRTGFRPWKELVQLFREMVGLIGPDTGPLHLAVASGTRVCALMGPTRPDWTGPYGQGHLVLQERNLDCVPCMKRRCEYREPLACMKRISPEAVLGVVRGWIADQDAS